jgi:hypothetical protein
MHLRPFVIERRATMMPIGPLLQGKAFNVKICKKKSIGKIEGILQLPMVEKKQMIIAWYVDNISLTI